MKIIIVILIAAYTIACNSSANNNYKTEKLPGDTIYLPNTHFQILNGFAYYNKQKFSGTVVELYPSGTVMKTVDYLKGLEDCYTNSYYPNGQIESKRFYTAGEKDGLHLGWWPNGHKRFEYHFKKGMYDGSFVEYYENGSIAKKINYKDGEETDGIGWRENGKVYMNFVMKDGRRYGLVNSKLCYSLKNENGEYVKNVAN